MQVSERTIMIYEKNQGLWRDRLDIPEQKRTLFTFRKFLCVTSPVGFSEESRL